MASMINLWITGALRQILDRENVNEVMINSPHNVFIETNGVMDSYDDTTNSFTLRYLQEIASLTANETKQSINKNSPILSATFPSGERIQVIMPPACAPEQFVISIRKPSVHNYTLDDYVNMGFFDSVNKSIIKNGINEHDEKLSFYEGKEDWPNYMREAVAGKKNIIISGGTGSGKTTFTNMLLNLINPEERLISLEDAREVLKGDQYLKRNIVNLLTSQAAKGKEPVTFSELIKACLRLRPDRILLSELRGSEAFDFLNAINTGHNGSITSLHANSAKSVYDRLVTMIKMSDAGRGLNKADIYDYCKSSIDIIMQCEKCNGVWRMVNVLK